MNGIDYAALWKSIMAQKSASGNPYREKPEAAIAYDRSETIWADGFRRAAAFPAAPEDTVLDIGSGPGVLAVPLAARVRSVTAVEPSETMVALMLRHAEERQVRNLRVLNCRWEDADPGELGRFDHVIASYSFYMHDMDAALSKMDAVARKTVTLYWFCGLTSWERIQSDLYPTIYGRPFLPSPKSDLLYGILSDMNRSANVTDLTDTAFDRDFPDMQSAILDMRGRLKVDTARWDGLFEDYVRAHHLPLENGGWRYVDRTHYVRITWKPEHSEGCL